MSLQCPKENKVSVMFCSVLFIQKHLAHPSISSLVVIFDS